MGSRHRFRFGVQCSDATSATAWREQARKIEDLGYSTLFMPDHYADMELAPMVGMAVAAEATTSLRIGSLVFDNDYKHPAVLAKEAATLDVLSDGRLELGVGAGWQRSDYDALGLPYDPPGVRIARLAEALQVIRGAWGDKPFSFRGEHYTITDYDARPKPVQSPPPIMLGGGGRRMLTLAGREADVVGINPNLRAGEVGADAVRDSVAEMTRKKLDWIRDGAGDRFDEIELQLRYFFAAITDDRVGLANAVAPGMGLSPEDALDAHVALVGTVDEIVDQLVERRETWGVTYVVVGADVYEQFAPVVARLAGT
ncbi:MAG TPA: TIGR03621 family F420-dependent LLM class oxidoreductase [Acidimicrobiia bacterium]|nr:TIGR03621 family F420-dependent LLM class oxidoreductase [Acidimicrobiia bacterium]